MTRKQLLIGLVVVAVVGLGVAAWFVFSGPSSDATASATPTVLLTKDDHTLGSPKAPVTVIEYAAPMCPHCAHFDMNVFPDFKREYIDTGKVYFVFRVYPLGAPDVAVEAMAQCLPKENYFSFIDMMYRNQSQWDPDGYTIPDIHGALVHMGAIAGLTSAQVDTCIGDQAAQQRIQQVGTDAQARYGVYQTPSFIIDGRLANPVTLEDMKAILDPELAKK
ncbi:MAG TPA: thioredoxin domain-containing protein [Rhizomicrobium sp.]|nr:thioredoxin domain-containing protein [Rhizomicrobium sp.]